MNQKLSRRQFLKIGGALGLAAAGSSLLRKQTGRVEAASIGPRQSEKAVPTICEICFWKCGMIAHVQGGRVVKIQGNPDHPLSNGKLCPRGMSAPGIINDEDRLKRPLIRRKASDGKQFFQEVSWEEALDFTAKRLMEISEKHGPETIALFSHGSGGSLFKKLLNAMGSATITAPSFAQCRGPRDAGMIATFGQGAGNPELLDVPNTRCLVLIGSHLGENMHNTAVQDLATAIGNGATLITVDPRYSTVAGKSDHWLPIKPGTDIALLLAWIHVLIEEDIYQKDFVARNAVGFAQLATHVKDRTPEWAFTQTGIEPALIRETARAMARYAPASLVHPGRHVVWYGDDTQRSRAIAILNALLGNYEKKGGFYIPAKFTLKAPAKKAPDHPAHPEPKPKVFDFPPEMLYPMADEIPSQEVVNASLPGEKGITTDHRIHAWIAYGCNIPTTLPNPAKVMKAMEALDLLVAVDILPAEITGYADVVLPECTFLERYDELDSRPFRTAFLALRQPVVEPMYDSKPGYWIARELARRITVNGNNLSHLFPAGDLGDSLKKTVEAAGLRWEDLQRKGVLVGAAAPMYSEGALAGLKTPSGKIELYSQKLKDLGFDPLPGYTPPREPPDGSFRLLFGRSPVHTFSRTTNNSYSLEIFPENELWLNATMGRILGLRNGVYVMLENQDGVKTGPIRLKLTKRIREDCVYMVHGFGRWDSRLSKGYHKGASDSLLVSRYVTDPIMGGTGMNVNFVTITRAL